MPPRLYVWFRASHERIRGERESAMCANFYLRDQVYAIAVFDPARHHGSKCPHEACACCWQVGTYLWRRKMGRARPRQRSTNTRNP